MVCVFVCVGGHFYFPVQILCVYRRIIKHALHLCLCPLCLFVHICLHKYPYVLVSACVCPHVRVHCKCVNLYKHLLCVCVFQV